MNVQRVVNNGDVPVWRKSSYSGPDGGDCVEVAAGGGVVRVRDSKAAAGPVVSVSPGAWSSFLGYAVTGRDH